MAVCNTIHGTGSGGCSGQELSTTCVCSKDEFAGFAMQSHCTMTKKLFLFVLFVCFCYGNPRFVLGDPGSKFVVMILVSTSEFVVFLKSKCCY